MTKMHQSLSLRMCYVLFVLTISIASASGQQVDPWTNLISKRLTYYVKSVAPSLQPKVIEAVFKPAESTFLERYSRLPGQTPNEGIDEIEPELPVYNATSALKLPPEIELNLRPNFKELLQKDPMRFRFTMRLKAEKIERESALVDVDKDGDYDLFDIAADLDSSTSSEAARPTTRRIVSSVVRLTKSTATREAEAYASKVLDRIIPEARQLNAPPMTTMTSLDGTTPVKYRYKTMTTNYGPTLGMEAFQTSYLIVIGEATSTSVPDAIKEQPSPNSATREIEAYTFMACIGIILQAILFV